MNDEQDTALMPQEEMVEIQVPAPFSYRGKLYEPDDRGKVMAPRSLLPHLGEGSFPVWIHPNVMKAASKCQSHFGGLLVRWYKDSWSWVNGGQEPNIRDLRLSDLYPNVQANYGAEIQIPVWFAHHFPELRWVVNGEFEEVSMEADYTQSPEGRSPFDRLIVCSQPAPKAYKIPLSVWKAHDEQDYLGPSWPDSEDDRITEKAKLLGWKGYED
jgi:hypothetical protein